MPFSSGTFSVFTPGTPYSAGNTISSSVANSVNTDFATGLSTCLLKDGSQTVTANIPMSNFKFTGLGAGTALTDSATVRQAQYGFGAFLTSVAGTNTITGTATPTPAYTVGQLFTFVPAVTNTGATTLNISSVGAGAVQWAGAALTGGELVAGTAYTVYVTAVTPVFEIVGATQFPDSRALVIGATDATKKLRFEVDGFTTGNTRVATPPDEDFSVGFRNIPQNSQSVAYELVLADSGKHVLHPTADNNPRTFTIPANASVVFATGTAVTFVNQINTVTIAITSDTLTLAGSGSTGSRTLAANGIATALKVAATSWVISGTGLT